MLRKSSFQEPHIWLGFFADFRDPTVLLSGTPASMRMLLQAMQRFAAGADDLFAIHELAFVALRDSVPLYATKSSDALPNAFCWQWGPMYSEEHLEKFEALVTHGRGHQYFDLIDQQADLVLSIGEYDEQWWRAHSS